MSRNIGGAAGRVVTGQVIDGRKVAGHLRAQVASEASGLLRSVAIVGAEANSFRV